MKKIIISMIIVIMMMTMIGTARILRRNSTTLNIHTNAKLTHSVKKLTTAFFPCSRDKFANDKYI